MNIRRIAVCVNETPAAAHALREAAVLADAAGAELIALTVVEDPWRAVLPEEVEGTRRFNGPTPADVAERRSREHAERLIAATIGAGRARPMVLFGVPGIELARWADMAKADLLVLGRQPSGDLGRRPAGRTIAGTLGRARIPCLLVPFGQRSWRRVLAAIASGPAGPVVREVATAFAALWGEAPRCVHVESHMADVHAVSARSAAVGGGTAALTLDRVAVGDPVGELLRTVREEHTDTLVIGYHRGETTAEAGRVAPLLLERAPCAVLTVPL